MNTKNELSIGENDFGSFLDEGFTGFKNQSRSGMRHNINASSSIKLFGKNVTINPAYQLSSLWYLNQINKSWDTQNNEVINDTVNQFSSIYSHSLSASATTKIYGFYQFAKIF